MRASGGQAELGGEQVEGHHAVHELLRVARRRTRRVWFVEGQLDRGPLHRIVELARERGIPVHPKTNEALLAVARTGAPQGVVAWADPVAATELDELLVPGAGGPRPSEGTRSRPAGPAAPFLLVLDGVTDPGNFGSILRSAACAGASGVVIARHRSAPLTPAAVKAAAGAVELVPICQAPGIPAALQQVAKSGIWTVGLDPGGQEDVWRTSLLDGPVALVLGSEGGGLSHLVRQRCDVLARIPQAGPLGSLNVAAAGAVACFEVARRRLRAPRD
jgi:23S rRNA (guanosine2251-2'-O)-methyltransferase